jgi:hypothetical protein
MAGAGRTSRTAPSPAGLARPAAGDDVEWRRRLTNLLAVTAGELLPDVLDHLPGFRGRHLHGFGGGEFIFRRRTLQLPQRHFEPIQ